MRGAATPIECGEYRTLSLSHRPQSDSGEISGRGQRPDLPREATQSNTQALKVRFPPRTSGIPGYLLRETLQSSGAILQVAGRRDSLLPAPRTVGRGPAFRSRCHRWHPRLLPGARCGPFARSVFRNIFPLRIPSRPAVLWFSGHGSAGRQVGAAAARRVQLQLCGVAAGVQRARLPAAARAAPAGAQDAAGQPGAELQVLRGSWQGPEPPVRGRSAGRFWRGYWTEVAPVIWSWNDCSFFAWRNLME